MANFEVNVEGMTCDHCRGKVEAALKALDGVYGVMVDLEDGVAEVDTSEASVTVETVVAAIEAAGYKASAAS